MEKCVTFRSPKTIHYGRGAISTVGSEAAQRGKKALIVSDKVMHSLGFVNECQNLLMKEGVESEAYLGVATEPTDVYVEESLEILKKEKCDLVISLGGGSCIDTAKSIAVLATNGGYIGDYIGGKQQAKAAPVAHIAIPTTAGTGSEVTDATVIANSSNNVKMMIKQPAFLPEVAVVDPALTLTAPKGVTAATGVDALSHAIEAYISKLSHPMTDTMALSAMRLIVNNIMKSYVSQTDLDAKEAMSLGALQAGLAFSNASVCLVHGMSRPIGALFHVPHGISNAMLLPAVLEFSKYSALSRLADLGRIFSADADRLSDEKAADIAIASVKKLCSDLDIPNLREWGIDQQAFESALGKMAQDALASGSPAHNPRVPSLEEIKHLYKTCFEYDFLSADEK